MRLSPGYWTKERVMAEAKKHKRPNIWRTASISSYLAAHRGGYYSEAAKHMGELTHGNNYWTVEKCQAEALRFTSVSDWAANGRRSYHAACKLGCISLCAQHMSRKSHEAGYWSLERCLEEAMKYTTRYAWQKASPSSYNSAWMNGWREMCIMHMIEVKKPSFFWNKKHCIEEARKHASSGEWQKASITSYGVACKNGWLAICTKHMRKPIKWTKKLCIEEAKKYDTRTKWQLGSSASYQKARAKGWLNSCSKHMIKSWQRVHK